MKPIFIDTSAFYALFNRDDIHHEQAQNFYQQNSLFVTTQTLIMELLSLLTKRQGKEYAVHVAKQLRVSGDRVQIVHLSEAQIEKAWQLFLKHKDKDYDLVDCSSFAYMKENKIEEAFAFDKHFSQFGLKKIPVV